MASKMVSCENPQEAELMAIEWESEIVLEQSWNNVIWSSDALGVIKAINFEANPTGWDTKINLLKIRDRRKDFNWLFNWNSRDTNKAADFICNFAFKNNLSFVFHDHSNFPPPFDIKEILLIDLGGK